LQELQRRVPDVKAERNASGDAILVIDVLSDFRFEGGATLLRRLQPRIPTLGRLLQRARRAGVPVVYANDNLGRWRSSVEDLGERIRTENPRAWRALAPLHPQPCDYVVLKPRHSAFYCTPLELLLQALDVRRLVLTGVSATSCIWFTAADAHLRGYEVLVPQDGIAARSPRLTRAVLELLQDALGAGTQPSVALRLQRPRRAQRAAG
jgi:nicotinamidase-related amidase